MPHSTPLRHLRYLFPLTLFHLFGGGVGDAHAGPVFSAPQDAAESVQPIPRYRVYLWTMDQGDVVYEMFGHNALVIVNETTGESLAWNWGLFNFEDVDFIPRFLRGTMRYSMGPADPGRFLQYYREVNRSVFQHEIHLTDEEALALDTFVRWNYLPENRAYTYDYFRDNCSTRVRDALDGVLAGALSHHFRPRETTESYRRHARRLVQRTGWVDHGLSFLLGTRGDRPITEWEAMYIPMVLMEQLEGFTFEDGTGATRTLLGPRETLFQATRQPTPASPPSFAWSWLLGGVVGAGLILLAGTRAGGRAPRVVFLGALTAWGLLAGLLGSLLVAAWFTDHHFIHRNLNLFHANPLHLLLLPLAFLGLVRSGRMGRRALRWSAGVAILIGAASLVGALAQLVGVAAQGNGEIIALALPLNLAFAVALRAHHTSREG